MSARGPLQDCDVERSGLAYASQPVEFEVALVASLQNPVNVNSCS